MAEIRCFFAEPIAKVNVELRRYVGSEKGKCAGPYGYHNASVVIEVKEKPLPPPEDRYESTSIDFAHDDARWPKACPCGYEFQEGDEWQTNEHRLYAGGDKEFALREAPSGAMWDAWWWGDDGKGPDGIHLVVQTPGGEWMPDRPSRNQDGTQGPSWQRSGSIPDVTVRPSILMRNYHGYLTNGVLSDC